MITKSRQGWGQCEGIYAFGQIWKINGAAWMTRPLATVTARDDEWCVRVGAQTRRVGGDVQSALAVADELIEKGRSLIEKEG